MSGKLQVVLVISSVITFCVVLRNIYKTKMNVKYAVIWISLAFFLAILSLFPFILDEVSILLGIAAPTNTLFLITIFISYLLSFYLYLNISKNNDKIKKMNYEIAELKRKLEKEEKND